MRARRPHNNPVTDAYRTPDNPLARALEQGRADLARQRAEQDERDRANAAAVEDLRATLGALDPPLALRMEPERGLRYEGQDAPVYVVAWAPAACEGVRIVRIESAANDAPNRVAGARFAAQIEALLEAERRAKQAQRALEPPPVVLPPSPSQADPRLELWHDEAWRDLWAFCGLLSGAVIPLLVGWFVGAAVPAWSVGGAAGGAMLGYLLAPD